MRACVFSKVGKSGLNINQQWAMTAHISCQTLSKCRLNARLFSPLLSPVPSCLCTIFLLLSFAWLLSCYSTFDTPIDFRNWENPSTIQLWNDTIGTYLPFVIFMWLLNNSTQSVWKLSENKNYCELSSRTHTPGNFGCSTLKMTMAKDFYSLLFYKRSFKSNQQAAVTFTSLHYLLNIFSDQFFFVFSFYLAH